VTPGAHTVSVQLLSFDATVVKMRRSTMMVHYTP